MHRFVVSSIVGYALSFVVGCDAMRGPPQSTRCRIAAKPTSPQAAAPQALPTLSDDAFKREMAVVEKEIDPATAGVELMWVRGNWGVWSSTQPIEKYLSHRMRRELCKTYLQRLPDGRAQFVEKHVGSPFRFDIVGISAAATDDGTLITHRGHTLEWRSTDGTTVRSPELKEWVEQIDVDGVLVQDPTTNGEKGRQIAGAFRFIPLAGKALELERAVELAPAGLDMFLHHDAPVRHGNEFGWTEGRVAHFVDIKSGRRREVELKAPAVLHPSHFRLVAFDERVIHAVLLAFNAESGEVLGEADLTKRSTPFPPLVALHGGISYHIIGENFAAYRRGGRIIATNPHSKTSGYVAFAEAPYQPIGRSATGLNLWTGTEWRHVPWLTSIPDDAPRVEVK